MARRSGLGRGLDSLNPGSSEPSEAPPSSGSGLTELAVGDIDPNPHQPRSHFDEETLASLAASVREHFGDKVCKQVIPRTVRLSEAPSYGQSIITFDPSSRGAIAYRELAKEVSHGPS